MKRVIVWGSEGEIGRGIARVFKGKGWEIVAVAREITGKSSFADWSFEADFTRPEEVATVRDELERMSLSMDVYVYAGGDIAAGKVRQMDAAVWDRILANNLSGVFHTLQASLPVLAEKAHIFILGAISERLQLPGLSAYAAAKAGLEAFAVALSKEERKKSISVVRPGAVATDLWRKVPFKQPSHAMEVEDVGHKIWEAYNQGHSGNLDLA